MMQMTLSMPPLFYLYGEPHRQVDGDFIHVETLDDRTRASEWTIRPHSHAELNHLFLVIEGGGTLHVDGQTLPFLAPAMLVIPATTVHGFDWSLESCGWVATVAGEELRTLSYGDADIAQLFDAARTIQLSAQDGAAAEHVMGALARELGWVLPARRVGLRHGIMSLILIALRQAVATVSATQPSGHHAAMVARFRERVEQRFREREPMAAYANALGISESGLRAACKRIAGQSPTAILDQRTILEAQRALLYSDMPVAEIGYALGFADPGYFSRFFVRHVGQPPRSYRADRHDMR